MLARLHEEWLTARKIDVELATRYGLCTDEQRQGGRVLVFPYLRNGRTINHKYRAPDKRFSQDEGAPKALWNEDALRDPTLASYPIIATEGELDALAAIQAGFPRSVSVPDGAGTNLDFLGQDPVWPLLRDAPTIIIASDGDEPGRKLASELARRLGAARCSWLTYPEGCKDLNDVLIQHGEAGVKQVIEGAKPYPVKGLFTLDDYPDVPEPETYPSGWINLNPHLRLWAGEFFVVTGVPSAGKSLWTLNLLANLAELHGHRSVVASFEMPVKPYVERILTKFRGGNDARSWVRDHFVFIDQDPRDEDEEATIEWLIEKAEDAVIRHGVQWFLIDPWNQVDHDIRRAESEEQYQRRAIKSLKRFARSFQVGVIVVAHPTKDIKGRDGTIRKPNGYDIAGSAHWVNAPDHLVVVDRPSAVSSEVEVAVLKSRHASGGMVGSAFLAYEPATGRYRPTVRMEDAPT